MEEQIESLWNRFGRIKPQYWPSPIIANGIDTATDVSGIIDCLKGKGISFIGRYFAVENTWKALTKDEAQKISDAGMYIVSIWEDEHPRYNSPEDYQRCLAYFTKEQGRKDGYNAFKYAYDMGQTPYTPVYFAVDFDVLPKDKQHILNYFEGVKEGYEKYLQEYGFPYKIGVYGSYWVLSWLKKQGIATYFYQAYAPGWSGGENRNPWPGYNIRQISLEQPFCSIGVDHDIASSDFGGWRITKINHPPIAEAAVSTSPNGPYYGYENPLTVIQGQKVSLYFFADKDVNGDGKASFDPDGWNDPENGVSFGGKCEWNTDLKQGTPTFKKVIPNPSSPADCNIGPYPYTFNDPPGTYEYQVLRITDRKGAQSDVSKIRIKVQLPSLISVDVKPDTWTMKVGEEKQFSATATYKSGKTEDVTTKATWSSSDSSVLEHLGNGKFKALKKGSATVTAVYGGKKDSSYVTVTKPDITPPTTSCTLSGTTGENNWYTSSVTVRLSASDSSGVDYIKYRIDTDSWRTYSGPFTVSSDGSHTVYYYAVDKAGNRETTKIKSFRIDKTKPPAPSPDDGVSGWNKDCTPTFRWSAPRDTSGIAGYYWKVDGGSDHWTTSTSVTIRCQSDGIHTFYVKAKDKAGNIGRYGSHQFKIDATKPSSHVNKLPLTQTTTSFTVSWTGYDPTPGSGIKCYDVQYKKDESSWKDWITCTKLTSKTFSGEYGHTYYFRSRAQDNAGNWEEYGGADTYTRISDIVISIDVKPDSWTMDVGEEKQFKSTATYKSGRTEDVTTKATWSSSDSSVLENLGNGKFKALKGGSATVTASYKGRSDSSDVIVSPNVRYYTFQTTDNAMRITIDGKAYNSPHKEQWKDGETHRVSTFRTSNC